MILESFASMEHPQFGLVLAILVPCMCSSSAKKPFFFEASASEPPAVAAVAFGMRTGWLAALAWSITMRFKISILSRIACCFRCALRWSILAIWDRHRGSATIPCARSSQKQKCRHLTPESCNRLNFHRFLDGCPSLNGS